MADAGADQYTFHLEATGNNKTGMKMSYENKFEKYPLR